MIRTNNPTEAEGAPIEVEVVNLQRGKSSAYDPKKHPGIIYSIAILGSTREQIADCMGVTLARLESWLFKYPEFRKKYEEGREIADYGVERTLIKRAMGYDIPETKHYAGVDSLGRPWERTVTTVRHIPGDPLLIKFWLVNRHPDKYSDTRKSEVNNTIDVNINKTLQLNLLTPAQRELVKGIAIKQIASMNGISTD